jgi:hypothetical protein
LYIDASSLLTFYKEQDPCRSERPDTKLNVIKLDY